MLRGSGKSQNVVTARFEPPGPADPEQEVLCVCVCVSLKSKHSSKKKKNQEQLKSITNVSHQFLDLYLEFCLDLIVRWVGQCATAPRCDDSCYVSFNTFQKYKEKLVIK